MFVAKCAIISSQKTLGPKTQYDFHTAKSCGNGAPRTSGHRWGAWCYSIAGSHGLPIDPHLKATGWKLPSQRRIFHWEEWRTLLLIGWTMMKFCWHKWEDPKEVWKRQGKSWPDSQRWLLDPHGLFPACLPAPRAATCRSLVVSNYLPQSPGPCGPSFVLIHSGSTFCWHS